MITANGSGKSALNERLRNSPARGENPYIFESLAYRPGDGCAGPEGGGAQKGVRWLPPGDNCFKREANQSHFHLDRVGGWPRGGSPARVFNGVEVRIMSRNVKFGCWLAGALSLLICAGPASADASDEDVVAYRQHIMNTLDAQTAALGRKRRL